MALLIMALLLHVLCCHGGEEVFAGFSLSPDDLRAGDIAVIQFDTRPLADYWNASAHWNKGYSRYHGHKYAYLSMRKPCRCGNYKVSPVWCKVKAMVHASKVFPTVKAFIYLDSDAVVTSNYSIADILGFMRHDLRWDLHEKPVAFNQDGPGWSCKYAMDLGYNYCLNSGTVLWLNTPEAKSIIAQWWDSCADDYADSIFPSQWRTRWPWEQAQMFKVYNNNQAHIQRLSFPNASFLPWTSTANPKSQYPTDAIDPWCFSHWPGAKCFITHHCASKKQKAKMIDMYRPAHPTTVRPVYID